MNDNSDTETIFVSDQYPGTTTFIDKPAGWEDECVHCDDPARWRVEWVSHDIDHSAHYCAAHLGDVGDLRPIDSLPHAKLIERMRSWPGDRVMLYRDPDGTMRQVDLSGPTPAEDA